MTGPSHPAAASPVKVRIAAAVEAHREEILDLSHRIHANPEPAFEEHEASRLCAETIARYGYSLEHPAGRLATAVRGRLAGAALAQAAPAEAPSPDLATSVGSPGRVGVLAEYDALPGLGHGCGHNTMAASGVGAALALAEVRDALPGEVVFLGCPAEEFGSGKQFMLDDGLFAGLDAALLFHPGDRTQVACELLAAEDVEVTFTGLQAHAASEPWEGRNALDALVLLFSSIGLWRQQLPRHARVHGIVVEGGTAPNIIPDRAVGRFMIRSADQGYYARMRDRFRALVEAAALATDTNGEAVFSGGSSTMNDNTTLAARFRANLGATGMTDLPFDTTHIGSSDMGNVSWSLPTIHPSIAICRAGVPGHSIEFREAAASPEADRITLLAATVVAQTAYDVLADPALRAAAWSEFRSARDH
jgi:amidohydrolase